MALPVSSKVFIGLFVGGAVFYLVSTSSGEGVLDYIFVDKVVDNPAMYSGRMIKVHGTVVPAPSSRRRARPATTPSTSSARAGACRSTSPAWCPTPLPRAARSS